MPQLAAGAPLRLLATGVTGRHDLRVRARQPRTPAQRPDAERRLDVASLVSIRAAHAAASHVDRRQLRPERVEDALPLFARSFRMNPNWMLLVPRLVEVDQLPATPGLVDRILAVGPTAKLSPSP